MKNENKEYQILCNLASEYVNFVMTRIEGSKSMRIANILLGIGGFSVEKYKGSGHNYSAVIDAIYDYYRQHPDSDIAELVDKGIKETVIGLSTTGVGYLPTTIGIFEYILKCQKEHTAPFELNVKEYMELTKQHIMNNKEHYIKKNLENPTEWINEKDQYLEEKYHYHH